jgi:Fe-S-cluster containining protein
LPEASLHEAVAIPSLHDPESQRLATRMTELAQAMAGCEGVAGFADTGWLPDRFFALLDELYAAHDAYVAHNLAASGLAVQCRFGCTRCCHQAVHGLFVFEIVGLYRQLRPLDAIHAALADYAARFQATLDQIGDADEGGPADPVLRTLEAFAAAAAPCPLLLRNNCRVYARRPMPCRMVHSLTDPVYCTTAEGNTFNIELPQAAGEILWSLSDRLAYPFPTFLAQGLVTFAERREFRPWGPPGGA